ncbi:cytosolic phospholipase A2 gamma-like [Brachyhypopomus gauderio]|uniref:cytosolic phospholipase A2 gamma-like n=1 Tax=Brachyhypopomus gauderio TaxID=698409 RepID=UPI004043600F
MDQNKRAVRLGHSLNEAERQHVSNRRGTVQQCLQKHNIPCSLDEVPNIAVLGSGGGERAMIGLLGSLSQLGEEGLLDCIMYLSGVSGSTWCMSSVYKEPDWSTKMETVKQGVIKKLNSGQVSKSEQYKRLEKMTERDNFSITDIWSALVVSNEVKEINEHVLTEQRGLHTRDPYPIYTVIDKQCSHDKLHKDVWFEITPDECGYSLTGAFVDSTAWGSLFDKGAVTKKQPQIDILSLQGLCSSTLAEGKEFRQWILQELQHFTQKKASTTTQAPNKDEAHQVVSNLVELTRRSFTEEDPSVSITKMNDLLKGKQNKDGRDVKLHGTITNEALNKFTMDVCDSFFVWFKEHDIWRVIIKCMMKVAEWDWGTQYNFLYNTKAAEVHPSILKSKTRQYEDAGLLLNSPYFSVLRKERNVDLIISFDFSAGDPFETADNTAQMCKDLQVFFPTVKRPGNDQEPDDFYVFEDNPTAPTVIHIPLFNAGNCKGEVKKWKDRYWTYQSQYTEEMVSDLLEKAALNIKNTKQKLLKVIEEVIQRKKKH